MGPRIAGVIGLYRVEGSGVGGLGFRGGPPNCRYKVILYNIRV